MYASTSFQRIKLRDAVTYDDLASTPLILNFESTDRKYGHGEIAIHLENAPLARALVEAINETLKSFNAVPKTAEAT
jgi:hypothetical protein